MKQLVCLAILALTFDTTLGRSLAAPNQVDLDAPISLSLKNADGGEVLRTFARLIGAEIDLDPALRGGFTGEFVRVPVANAMHTVCEQLGCRLEVVEGDPPVLKVVALVSVELAQANVVQVLESLARISAVELDLDPDLEMTATVTVRFTSVPWLEALNAVCDAAQVQCSLEEGEVPRLRVENRSPGSQAPQGDLGVIDLKPGRDLPDPSELEKGMRRPIHLRAGFGRENAGFEGKVGFSWTRPIFSLRAQAEELEMRLSWVPLGSGAGGAGVVVPYLIDCAARTPDSQVRFFDPVPLPLDEPVTLWAGDAFIRLQPMAPHDESAALVPDALEESCLDWEPVDLAVTRSSGGSPLPLAPRLNAPGKFVHLVMPAIGGGGEPTEAAIVLLGKDGSQNPRVGILTEAAAEEGGGVSLSTGVVLPDSPWTTTLPAPDGTFVEITIGLPQRQ